MVTTINRETESPVVVAAPAVEPAAVDVSAIPETPAELLQQWDAPKRSILLSIPAAIVNFWCSLSGPGMTEQGRIRREIAEINGSARVRIPYV